jgi:hypothetical protein
LKFDTLADVSVTAFASMNQVMKGIDQNIYNEGSNSSDHAKTSCNLQFDKKSEKSEAEEEEESDDSEDDDYKTT